MIRFCKLAIWIGLPGMLGLTQFVYADNDEHTVRQLRETGEILPLETILQKIQAAHPGKVLEVELEEKQSRLVYEIELLDSHGKVWELQVDPRSGDLLDKHKEK